MHKRRQTKQNGFLAVLFLIALGMLGMLFNKHSGKVHSNSEEPEEKSGSAASSGEPLLEVTNLTISSLRLQDAVALTSSEENAASFLLTAPAQSAADIVQTEANKKYYISDWTGLQIEVSRAAYEAFASSNALYLKNAPEKLIVE